MRWKAVIPTVVIVALIAVFCIFFLDPIVECAIERTGTALNGAKVELDSVDVGLRDLSLTLNRLQVTDKDAPMTNAVEIDRLTFDLAGKPLTWKKIIIETGEIAGVRAGTDRKTSGALPRRTQKSVGAAEEETPSKIAETGQKAASFAMTNLKEQYDPEKLIKPEDLASYKKIQEEQARLTALAEGWESKVDGVNVSGQADAAKAFAQRVKTENFSGLEGVKKAKDMLAEADRIKSGLDESRRNFNSLKDGVKSEIAQARDAVKQIDALRKQDVENAVSRLKEGAFSAEGITRGLIGAEWLAKIQQWLRWFHKARRLIPQKKEGEKAPPPPPRVGKEIPFPFRYNWPSFHLKSAHVNGTAGKAKPVTYQGKLTDVSSDPKLVGKPIVLDVSNEKEASDIAFAFRGELDYTQDVPRERANLTYRGLRLDGVALGNLEAPVTIQNGKGAITADLQTTGDQLGGGVRFGAEPVRLAYSLPPEKAGNKLLSILQNVLTGLNQLTVELAVSNTVRQPKFDPKTNLDNAFNDAVKQVLQKELDELRAQFRQRVDRLVEDERKKLAGLVESKSGAALGKLDSKEAALRAVEEQIQKTKDELKDKAQQAVPVPVPGGDKKPAAEDLKKDIKGIFKR
jgi:uncharacterized protein (TIGR03545 family)